jgi:hypothetical protein
MRVKKIKEKMKLKIFSLVLIAILAVSVISSVSAINGNDGSNNLIDAQNVGTVTYHIEAKFYDANNTYLRCDYISSDLTGANRKWFNDLELKNIPFSTIIY